VTVRHAVVAVRRCCIVFDVFAGVVCHA
jgi:hypothetical protein